MFLLFLLFSSNKIIAQNNFEIRYLGNMGVAIIHKDSAIIIDGLHDFYEKYYLPTDDLAFNVMQQKQEPFKNIAAIVVTHKHNDHFDSALLTKVAGSHASAILIGGNQTKNLLGNHIQRRFTTAADSLTLAVNPTLLISLKKIPHVNPARHAAIENYRVEVVWDGFRVIHLGDAEILPFATNGIKQPADVVVVPYWFLEKEEVPTLKQMKLANIIIAHIKPPANKKNIQGNLKTAITYFCAYGDTLILH